jgi:hypothetical protein
MRGSGVRILFAHQFSRVANRSLGNPTDRDDNGGLWNRMRHGSRIEAAWETERIATVPYGACAPHFYPNNLRLLRPEGCGVLLKGASMLRVWGVSRARPASHDHAVRNSRPWSSSCVAFIHDCVILLVIDTVPGVTYMTSKRSAAHESVRVYRAKMKQQGFRQINIWVPDTRSPKFRKECRRQSRLASAADQSAQLDDLLNVAAGSVEGWT